MTTNRTPLDRSRKVVIDAETLAEFKALESTPMRQRKSQTFDDRDYALHRKLGLVDGRRFAQVSMFNRGPHYYQPGSVHYEAAERVCEMRLRLLEMAGLSAKRAS